MMKRVDAGLPPTEGDVVDKTSGTILATTGDGGATSGGTAGGGAGAVKRGGSVAIRNGNGLAGAGLDATERIQGLGYSVNTSNADNFDYQDTVVVYNDSSDKGSGRGHREGSRRGQGGAELEHLSVRGGLPHRPGSRLEISVASVLGCWRNGEGRCNRAAALVVFPILAGFLRFRACYPTCIGLRAIAARYPTCVDPRAAPSILSGHGDVPVAQKQPFANPSTAICAG